MEFEIHWEPENCGTERRLLNSSYAFSESKGHQIPQLCLKRTSNIYKVT